LETNWRGVKKEKGKERSLLPLMMKEGYTPLNSLEFDDFDLKPKKLTCKKSQKKNNRPKEALDMTLLFLLIAVVSCVAQLGTFFFLFSFFSKKKRLISPFY
jgi:hypothetical protein